MPYAPLQEDSGSFIQQTPSFDVSQFYNVDVGSDEFKELLVRLYQQVNNISLILNSKISGYYLQDEFVTSAIYFPLTGTNQLDMRPVYRKVIYITNLPAGVTPTPHGITIDANTSFTLITGVANDTAGFNYYPLPYVSAAGNIELRVDNINVVITNNSGVTFDRTYVILEYIKS